MELSWAIWTDENTHMIKEWNLQISSYKFLKENKSFHDRLYLEISQSAATESNWFYELTFFVCIP